MPKRPAKTHTLNSRRRSSRDDLPPRPNAYVVETAAAAEATYSSANETASTTSGAANPEYEQVMRSSWYRNSVTPADLQRLAQQPPGDFLINPQLGSHDAFLLHYSADGQVVSAPIEKAQLGLHLADVPHYFADLPQLVDYYRNYDPRDGYHIRVKLASRSASRAARVEPPPLPPPRDGPAPTSPRELLPSPPPVNLSMLPDPGYSIDDMCRWLHRLDLGHYTALFREHRIDGTALLLLQSAELCEMGIKVIGDRVKILSAIDNRNKLLRRQDRRAGNDDTQSVASAASSVAQATPRAGDPLYATVNKSGPPSIASQSQQASTFSLAVSEASSPGTSISQQQPNHLLQQQQPHTARSGAELGLENDFRPLTRHDSSGSTVTVGSFTSSLRSASMAPTTQANNHHPGTPSRDPSLDSMASAKGRSASAGASPSKPGKIKRLFKSLKRKSTRRKRKDGPSAPSSTEPSPRGTAAHLAPTGRGSPSPSTSEGLLSRFLDPDARRSRYFLNESTPQQAAGNLREADDRTFVVYIDMAGRNPALTLGVVRNGQTEMLDIEYSAAGLRLKDSERYFSSLSGLVEFYSSKNEEKPFLLRVAHGPSSSLAHSSALRDDDDRHRHTDWFVSKVTQASAKTVLEYEPSGTFLVRPRAESGFQLLYTVEGQVHSTRILETPRGLCLEDGIQSFDSLFLLVKHYSTVSGELLHPLDRAPGAVARKRSHSWRAEHRLFGRNDQRSLEKVIPANEAIWWRRDSQQTRDALDSLVEDDNGGFFVRHSHNPHCFILTYKHNGQFEGMVIHTKQLKDGSVDGVNLASNPALAFPTLHALVGYYSKNDTGDLKCRLYRSPFDTRRKPSKSSLKRSNNSSPEKAEPAAAAAHSPEARGMSPNRVIMVDDIVSSTLPPERPSSTRRRRSRSLRGSRDEDEESQSSSFRRGQSLRTSSTEARRERTRVVDFQPEVEQQSFLNDAAISPPRAGSLQDVRSSGYPRGYSEPMRRGAQSPAADRWERSRSAAAPRPILRQPSPSGRLFLSAPNSRGTSAQTSPSSGRRGMNRSMPTSPTTRRRVDGDLSSDSASRRGAQRARLHRSMPNSPGQARRELSFLSNPASYGQPSFASTPKRAGSRGYDGRERAPGFEDFQRQNKSPGIHRRQFDRYQPPSPAATWPWWQVGVPRVTALSHIRNKPNGAFVLRLSERRPNCYILSYMHNGQIRNEVVWTESGDLKNTKICLERNPRISFSHLNELLRFYSENQGHLACPLLFPGSVTSGTSRDSRDSRNTSRESTRRRSGGDPSLGVRDRQPAPRQSHAPVRQQSAHQRWGHHPAGQPAHRGSPHRSARLDRIALHQPWCRFNMSRKQALEVLSSAPDGAFVVRDSTSGSSFAALTMVANGRLYQTHIQDTEFGLNLRGSAVYKPTLSALVAYYTYPSQVDLPQPLKI